MKQKIEQVKKLWSLEDSSQFDGEKQNAHDKAEKLYQDVRDADNSQLSMNDYLDKVGLISDHNHRGGSTLDEEIEKAKQKHSQRMKRKKIVEEMLDMWEKLGGEI